MLKIQRVDLLIIFLLSISFGLLLFDGLSDFGLAWDEGFYIRQGTHYAEWLNHPSFSTIKAYWMDGYEHPPIHKVLSALTKYIFTDRLHIADSIPGYRISTLFFAIVQIISLYILGLNLFGRFEAVVSCLMLLLLPHVFYHAHLVSLDFSAMAMWSLLAFIVWSTWNSQRNFYLVGIISGLALLTKINAIFALTSRFVLLIKRFCIDKIRSDNFWKNELQLLIKKIVLPCCLTVFILWPLLWKHPLKHLMQFIYFHIHHYTIPTYYLGQSFNSPPWHYPYVMFFSTTPLVIFTLVILGFLFLAPKWKNDKTFFLLTNALLPLFLVQMSSAKYDNVRLFLPAFPFLMLIAAYGLRSSLQIVFSHRMHKIALCVSSLFIVIYLGIINKNYYPYSGSYFSEAIGGISGAEKIGFDIHSWCDGYQSLLDWLQKNNDKKFLVPICYHLFDDYKDFGKIDWKLNITQNPAEADYWIIVNRRGLTSLETLNKTKQMKTMTKVTTHGVNLVEIVA
ncbi:MAG: ArnT family glycosyltransferase [Gammaproteobacteria bacterium]